jgi:hypothetical protein
VDNFAAHLFTKGRTRPDQLLWRCLSRIYENNSKMDRNPKIEKERLSILKISIN